LQRNIRYSNITYILFEEIVDKHELK
jgi:hypothetical protein